ncbi:MAG: hypothetical protein AAFV29_27330, partial [Myxococcota bacterium]
MKLNAPVQQWPKSDGYARRTHGEQPPLTGVVNGQIGEDHVAPDRIELEIAKLSVQTASIAQFGEAFFAHELGGTPRA